MCKCKKSSCCDCVVIIQRNAPPLPVFPPNVNTLQDVLARSCVSTSRSSRKCAHVVKELYLTTNELQNAYRRVNLSEISEFYDDTAVVTFNGQVFIGVQSISTGVVQPQLLGQTSVNPDYTSLTYQVHNEHVVTQYGTFSSTSTPTVVPPAVAVPVTTSYNVITTWVNVCDRWLIVNQVLTTLLL